MPSLPYPPLLEKVLRTVARRYRVPAISAVSAQMQTTSPAAALAIAIEQARAAVVRGQTPDAEPQRMFVEALARMIHEAMREEHGDPAFQAMVLRYRASAVREYASLSVHADRDRRAIRTAVDQIAHPAKQQRLRPGRQRQALARLHASASLASWSELGNTAQQLFLMPESTNETSLEQGLKRLLDNPALGRLQRLATLASDERVRDYRSLMDRQARSGSADTAAHGRTTRQRGAAVEALAARALETLARRLNETQTPPGSYRVVTSMRVPASIPGNPDRAKTEWDAVLLRQAEPVDAAPAWDVCLLVEAKASVDAATTDFPRLLRGLRLLAHARDDVAYPFSTQQGVVRLRGASLNALAVDAHDLAGTVLYCTDAPAEEAPRLLSAASRMQLLSTPASLAFASTLEEQQPANVGDLDAVWRQVLESPQWRAVLHQYATLRQARELMVHLADLSAAIGNPHGESYTT